MNKKNKILLVIIGVFVIILLSNKIITTNNKKKEKAARDILIEKNFNEIEDNVFIGSNFKLATLQDNTILFDSEITFDLNKNIVSANLTSTNVFESIYITYQLEKNFNLLYTSDEVSAEYNYNYITQKKLCDINNNNSKYCKEFEKIESTFENFIKEIIN